MFTFVLLSTIKFWILYLFQILKISLFKVSCKLAFEIYFHLYTDLCIVLFVLPTGRLLKLFLS